VLTERLCSAFEPPGCQWIQLLLLLSHSGFLQHLSNCRFSCCGGSWSAIPLQRSAVWLSLSPMAKRSLFSKVHALSSLLFHFLVLIWILFFWFSPFYWLAFAVSSFIVCCGSTSWPESSHYCQSCDSNSSACWLMYDIDLHPHAW
jgi:hypothetical protein